MKYYWAIKEINFDLKSAGEKRILDLHGLEKLRLNAYENANLYKEKTRDGMTRILSEGAFKLEIGFSCLIPDLNFIRQN